MFGMWIKNGVEFEELPAIRFVWFCQFHCFSSRVFHLLEQNPPVPTRRGHNQASRTVYVVSEISGPFDVIPGIIRPFDLAAS